MIAATELIKIKRRLLEVIPKCQTGFSDRNEAFIADIPIVHRGAARIEFMAKGRDERAEHRPEDEGVCV